MSPSRAECTNVPLTAWGDGGSGRCSITVNRKANGQLVKAVTLQGVKVRGRASAMAPGYDQVQRSRSSPEAVEKEVMPRTCPWLTSPRHPLGRLAPRRPGAGCRHAAAGRLVGVCGPCGQRRDRAGMGRGGGGPRRRPGRALVPARPALRAVGPSRAATPRWPMPPGSPSANGPHVTRVRGIPTLTTERLVLRPFVHGTWPSWSPSTPRNRSGGTRRAAA